ncbi:MAG: hypothetical protein R2759_16590 [Bacteroidales bacterium]
MLENFIPTTDEARRQLYVAMTRAKQNLTIHLNSNFLDNIKAENSERVVEWGTNMPSTEIVMQLSHEDVNLGYFEFVQHRFRNIFSGDSLTIKELGCANSNGD